MLRWLVMFYCAIAFRVSSSDSWVESIFSTKSNLAGTGNGCSGLLLLPHTGKTQYTDKAYAWEVATVGVCFHVLFSSFAMPVFWLSTNQRLDWFAAFGFERLEFVRFPLFDGFGFFCVAFS